MGDETKENELKEGNFDPLHATRKPSTADDVEERPAQVAEMPRRDDSKYKSDQSGESDVGH